MVATLGGLLLRSRELRVAGCFSMAILKQSGNQVGIEGCSGIWTVNAYTHGCRHCQRQRRHHHQSIQVEMNEKEMKQNLSPGIHRHEITMRSLATSSGQAWTKMKSSYKAILTEFWVQMHNAKGKNTEGYIQQYNVPAWIYHTRDRKAQALHTCTLKRLFYLTVYEEFMSKIFKLHLPLFQSCYTFNGS